MQADFALDYDVLTVEQPAKIYLMARLAAGRPIEGKRRTPLNLSLVVDRSGSMGGDKLNYTKLAAQFMVQNLSAQDTLSIVLYNETVETLLEPTPVTYKDAIIQKLNRVRVGGMTNLSGGWLQGCHYVAQKLLPEALNRVIVMTDGLANRGITEPKRLVALAQQKRESGVSTTTMGLGLDFNEDLLQAMAEAGGGAFYFIESPEVAPQIFEEELRGLLNIVGQNLVISVEKTDSITRIAQLNAYPVDFKGKDTAFQLGDVFADEVKLLVLELAIAPVKHNGPYQLTRLRFDYDEITASGSEHRRLELPVNVTFGAVPEINPNPTVQRSVLLLQAAQAKKDAISAADRGEFKTASQVLKQAAEAIKEAVVQDADLKAEQEALLKQSQQMDEGGASYTSYNRKMMSTQAVYTMTNRHEDTVMMRSREASRIITPPPTLKIERKVGVKPLYFTWNGQLHPLQGALMRMGRDPHNEVVINTKNVSRFHCQIQLEGEDWLVSDLGSTNGTYLNDVQLEKPQLLSVGDVVRVGHEHLVFHDNPDYSP